MKQLKAFDIYIYIYSKIIYKYNKIDTPHVLLSYSLDHKCHNELIAIKIQL